VFQIKLSVFTLVVQADLPGGCTKIDLLSRQEDTMTHRTNSLNTWALVAAVLSAGVFFAGAGTSFARSSVYCDDYARGYADRYSNSGGNVLGGQLGGLL
jgi:hypothetical protein